LLISLRNILGEGHAHVLSKRAGSTYNTPHINAVFFSRLGMETCYVFFFPGLYITGLRKRATWSFFGIN